MIFGGGPTAEEQHYEDLKTRLNQNRKLLENIIDNQKRLGKR